jgi:hypothetical protein
MTSRFSHLLFHLFSCLAFRSLAHTPPVSAYCLSWSSSCTSILLCRSKLSHASPNKSAVVDKHLVAYISELDTSKEIYDRLVSLFKVNDANQVLFLRNKLREIKKGKDESMQAYFLRITEIKNDLLSIGETITDREMALTTLGGLPSEWYVFRTTLLNNNVIPSFEELMARCIQEGIKEEDKHSRRLEILGCIKCT